VDIALDLSEVVTGDLSFTGNAATVTAIQGDAVTSSAPGDHTGLAWDSSASQFKHWRRDIPFGGWSRLDISTIGLGDTIMPRVGGAGTNVNVGYVMPCAGIITGISVYYTGNVDTGSDQHVLTVYKNGVATGVTLTVTGAVSSGYFFTGSETFAAGDKIDLYDKRNGPLSGVACQAAVWVILKS
jgi:hypothetical protein